MTLKKIPKCNITCRFEPEDNYILDCIAANQLTTKSAIIRFIIEDFLVGLDENEATDKIREHISCAQ